MSGFDRTDFENDLDDIETFLGYLRGNELMWDVFHQHELSTLNEPPWSVAWEYETPCSDGRFKVDFDHYTMIDVIVAEGEATQLEQKAQDLKDRMSDAWRQGPAWAAGVAAQARSICDQFTEPYVPTFAAAIDLMQSRVVNKLQISANDDWARLGHVQQEWSGQFAGNFNEFYDNYNDVISRYALFASWINVGFAKGSKIIAATQLGAGKFASSLKKNLEGQLDNWVDQHGGKPSDPSEWPAWVGDVAKVIDSTLGLASDVPIVGELADLSGLTKDVVSLMEDVDALVGGGLLTEKKEYGDVITAEAAYDLLITTLYDDHYKAFKEGMQGLNTGAEGSDSLERSISGRGLLEQMRDTKRRGDWALPEVPPENLA